MKTTSPIRPALTLLLVLTVLCGGAYPLLVTGIAKGVFARQADGDLIVQDGHLRGSRLIGQPFSAPGYFWGRPSATSPMPYNAAGSSGSNQGPTNPALLDAVKGRIAALRQADPDNHAPVPVDLVTASASGLDPDISPAAALYQAGRVAQARGAARAQVEALVRRHVETPAPAILGAPHVNVLALNLALDQAWPRR
ncbi:potassium-transporting ATPase subunit KdpC [Massilia sp. 9096]|uniref:potassium-transporting ATPase subunit KdpC n=1 Tax=Massilia sp. 9096 TaxID=1500894 RepID=UPI000A48942A|nr:potassium-transporting ATPase subunit KdpC [Massilia sp. 9096]